MATITVMVHTRGRHWCIFLCRLATILIRLRCYKAAVRVTQHIGLWTKIDVGRNPQWQWHNLGVQVVRKSGVIVDGR